MQLGSQIATLSLSILLPPCLLLLLTFASSSFFLLPRDVQVRYLVMDPSPLAELQSHHHSQPGSVPSTGPYVRSLSL